MTSHNGITLKLQPTIRQYKQSDFNKINKATHMQEIIQDLVSIFKIVFLYNVFQQKTVYSQYQRKLCNTVRQYKNVKGV